MLKLIKTITRCSIFLSTSLVAMEHAPHVPATLKDVPCGIISYLQDLPKIENLEVNGVNEVTTNITKFLCQFSNSRKMLTGVEVLAKKIAGYVAKNEPIKLILLGFPTKSAKNETKVIGSQVDLAELLGLLTLNHICQEINSVYEPGTQLTIFTREPFIYQMNNILEQALEQPLFDEDQIEEYQRQLKQLVNHFDPTIKVGEIKNVRHIYESKYAQFDVNAEDLSGYRAFMKEELNCSKFIEAAQEKLFSPQHEKLKGKFPQLENIKTFKEVKEKFSSYKKMLKNIESSLPKRNLLGKISDDLAECAAKGALRMRALLNDNISDYGSYVRLSIHASEDGDVSRKLGIALIYGSVGTPWHKTLVVSNDKARLQALSELKNKNGDLQGQIKQFVIESLNLGYVYQGD